MFIERLEKVCCPEVNNVTKYTISACALNNILLECYLIYRLTVKALSHGAIFLATCNAILLLGDVKLAKTCFHHSLLKYS